MIQRILPIVFLVSFMAGSEVEKKEIVCDLPTVVEALDRILDHIGLSDDIASENAIYYPASSRLRIAANEMDRKDTKVRHARAVLKACQKKEE